MHVLSHSQLNRERGPAARTDGWAAFMAGAPPPHPGSWLARVASSCSCQDPQDPSAAPPWFRFLLCSSTRRQVTERVWRGWCPGSLAASQTAIGPRNLAGTVTLFKDTLCLTFFVLRSSEYSSHRSRGRASQPAGTCRPFSPFPCGDFTGCYFSAASPKAPHSHNHCG